jgi:predicted dehydrogenase
MIRLGIVGAGNVGTVHIHNIRNGGTPEIRLVAVCDINQERLDWVHKDIDPGDPPFSGCRRPVRQRHDRCGADRHTALFPSGADDPCTGSWIALSGREAGGCLHQGRPCHECTGTGIGPGLWDHVQSTHQPVFRKIRDMVRSGELGHVKRISWITTDWYRCQSYYDSGNWRATWEGEGGGVLMNQAPHQIDLWQWMFGVPDRLRAFMSFGKYHDIEVEDEVTAYMEYDNGTTGVFITSTGETPGTNRLEVTGEMGKLIAENGRLLFYRNEVSERVYNKECRTGRGRPAFTESDITPDEPETAHVGILNNFAACILRQEELIAPGLDGIHEIAMSNAMHMSQWKKDEITLPFDDEEYFALLQERIAASDTTKKGVESIVYDITTDFIKK